MSGRSYMAISPGAIVPESLPEFRIYVRSAKGKYILWALEGNRVSSAQLARLTESGLKDIFVDLEETFKYEDYLETNLGKILENEGASDDQKATILSRVSTNVVKSAFETSFKTSTVSTDNLQRTQKLVENAMRFISESNSLPALTKMIGHDYQSYEHATKVLWFTGAFLRENPEVLERIQEDFETFDEQQRMETLRLCGVCALLHDIGKTYIPREILDKNGYLSEIEREIMKRHPLNGLAMLLDAELPIFVKKAILHHHEDFDGGGYPMSLAGTNITILARVLRIIDVFDAMTSRRPYKDPLPPMKAVQIMIGVPANTERNSDVEQDDRDQGMSGCFDKELLRKFIVFIGKVNLD
ncbi:MAG: HD domain-containing protein [Smithellaceae bacterium]|nr:HD domain-containing protein [Smithellaceae bacterium]